MRTPIAITASNGWLGVDSAIGAGVLEREGKRPADWMDGVEENGEVLTMKTTP